MISMVRLAVAAIGAGAVAAHLRARSRRGARPIVAPPPVLPPSAPAPDDHHAAIDAARSRLRTEAEALREEIEGDAPGR